MEATVSTFPRRAGTAAQVQKIIGCGRTAVFELARSGYIRRVHVPGRKRPLFALDDAERLVADGVDEADPHDRSSGR
jgi:hypothetical protein